MITCKEDLDNCYVLREETNVFVSFLWKCRELGLISRRRAKFILNSSEVDAVICMKSVLYLHDLNDNVKEYKKAVLRKFKKLTIEDFKEDNDLELDEAFKRMQSYADKTKTPFGKSLKVEFPKINNNTFTGKAKTPSYQRVTDSVFNLKDDLESGNLSYVDQGVHVIIETEKQLCDLLANDWVYLKNKKENILPEDNKTFIENANSCQELTKREKVAVKVMESLIPIYGEYIDEYETVSNLLKCLSETSVKYADALLKELENTPI